ncbi:MAG: 3-hydroxyacyl-[acyl-carrier-protein] dehydratase [Myxococcota bacterium]|jgi:3-hydroxyacyl-[acyl-carrier-protein] dehydratase
MRWQLVDRIESLIPGESAVGYRRYPADSPFFADHFPGFPVVPGVLILESLAQVSGKLIGYTVRKERGDWPFPILSMANNVKFRKFVRPDQDIRLETRITMMREEMAAVQVRAKIGKKVHAQAEQIFVFNAVPLDDPEEMARVEALERAHLKALWPDYPEES